jgi:hypothetical protein
MMAPTVFNRISSLVAIDFNTPGRFFDIILGLGDEKPVLSHSHLSVPDFEKFMVKHLLCVSLNKKSPEFFQGKEF